jgi:hypothetical protein
VWDWGLDLPWETTEDANDGAQSLLLLDERAGTVLPYSSNAFMVSTGPKQRVLQRYLGVLVVDRAGSVWRIDGIRFLGLWGESVWNRAFAFANGGTRRISVSRRLLAHFDFEQIRSFAIECLRQHPEVIQQYFDEGVVREKVVEQVRLSSTCAELFDALGMPSPENCLDSLT